MRSPQQLGYLNSISPRFMSILCFLIALLVSCVATHAQTALSTNQLEKIDKYVASRVAEQRIPGAALAIVEQDHITRVTGFGVADPTGRPVTAETPFILGSLTKSFTALAVMQLVEKGQINLDAKVRDYIPWFTLADDSSREVTVRQLLNQTSGLSVETSEKFAASSDVSDSALENRVRSLRTEHLDRAVGSTFEYSGTNYAVLGLLVQIVSSQSYEKYIQEHIFTPLKMEHTYTSQAEAEKNGLATGYLYWFFSPRATKLPFNRGSLPQGYIISTAEDMSHYLVAQLNDGRYGDLQILSAAGFREMHRPAIATRKTGTSYGMGWEIGPVAGIPAIWHEGSIFNYHANMVLIPRNGSGFILLENIYSGPDEGRLNQIADGVALLLTGRDPPPIASTARLKLAYGILWLILFVQVWIIVHVVRRLTSRHARPPVRPTVWGVSMLILAILLNLSWGLLIVFGIPRLFGMPLIITIVRVPDFGYVLLMSAFLAFSTSILKGLLGLSFFSNVRQVQRHLPSSS
jgi:CubicO group peptidase (beta-lactamase class C family)